MPWFLKKNLNSHALSSSNEFVIFKLMQMFVGNTTRLAKKRKTFGREAQREETT